MSFKVIFSRNYYINLGNYLFIVIYKYKLSIYFIVSYQFFKIYMYQNIHLIML